MGDFAHQEELDGRRVEPIRKTICKPFYSQAWFQTIGIIEERGSGTGGPVPVTSTVDLRPGADSRCHQRIAGTDSRGCPLDQLPDG